ncbi:MAG: ABC transporter ATP-binding protein [Nitrospirota bacterium]|nr:ABC transporter ATP-binding protein [Nitrospirota bacterium]
MIRTEGLAKEFSSGIGKKSIVAVRGLDLEVRKGEIFGFLGPNGAGKTTTLKMLMGLIYPTSGNAWILGKALGDVDVKNRIGYLPEHPYFYDYLTAREFLDFYGRLFDLTKAERRERIENLILKVGLDRFQDVQLRKFSKGMLQRIGIAQALINDPELVVLDEPMSGLDPIGRKEIRDVILWLRDSGKTVFFSSHILPDVEMLCDRVAIIVKGTLRDIGRLDELLGETVSNVEMVLQGIGEPVVTAIGQRGYRYSTVGDKIAVTVAGDAADDKVEEIVRLAMDSGGKVVSLTPHKKTLEELFVAHVGEEKEVA